MKKELVARGFMFLALIFAVLIPVAASWPSAGSATGTPVDLHARMAEDGGWTPGTITAVAGQPLHLRITSDDVLHGFAVGQSDQPAVDVRPGEVTELTLMFDTPGTYTFYCTVWCGPNHWRMRGVIEVSGPATRTVTVLPPLYVRLGIDLDAPHLADVIPEQKPSAVRGAALEVSIPAQYLTRDYYLAHSPAALWHALRAEAVTKNLTDQNIWDLVAVVWQSNTTPEILKEGHDLYMKFAAAAHGADGRGDGLLGTPSPQPDSVSGHAVQSPADFTNPRRMLGASPALLQGKMIRGGMGTGMPSWGSIFTDEQTWALVEYLWTFQFDYSQS
jgi:cytochrome c oxidase subunit 2